MRELRFGWTSEKPSCFLIGGQELVYGAEDMTDRFVDGYNCTIGTGQQVGRLGNTDTNETFGGQTIP